MAEWSVEMLARNEMTPVEVEERIEDLLENLDAYGGVVSYGAEGISARFFVEGERAKDAVWRGLRVFASALKQAGFKPVEVIRFAAESVEELEKQVMESNVPELVGVTELAQLLGVSRQRASELARSRDFPAPIAVLRSGPVWRKTAIARHVGKWERRPGRPRRTVVA